MKRWLLALLVVFSGAACAADAPMPVVSLGIMRGDALVAEYRVELATDAEQHRKGLMFREHMAPDAGMLFDFGRAEPIAMWMKNTFIALDMLYADDVGVVRQIIEGAEPHSERLLRSHGPVRYVVELNAGQVAEKNIKVGDRLRLPAQ